MKDKGLVWEVAYELKRYFSTEKEARRFYKKTTTKKNLKMALIRHRIKDNTNRIVDRTMSKICDHLDMGRTWRKLTTTEQKRILRVQAKAVSEILEEILT